MRRFRSRLIVGGIRVEGAEARRVLRDAYRMARKKSGRRPRRPVLIASAVSACVLIFVTFLLARNRPTFFGLPNWLIIFIVALIAGMVAGAVVGRISIRAHKEEIILAMRSRGYDLCTSCGYWLKGLADDAGRCPECGGKREPVAEPVREADHTEFGDPPSE